MLLRQFNSPSSPWRCRMHRLMLLAGSVPAGHDLCDHSRRADDACHEPTWRQQLFVAEQDEMIPDDYHNLCLACCTWSNIQKVTTETLDVTRWLWVGMLAAIGMQVSWCLLQDALHHFSSRAPQLACLICWQQRVLHQLGPT